MSASMLQSLQGAMGGVGQQATPGMQQALMQANPGMTPQMAQGATVAGVQSGAPSSLTAGLDPMQIIAQSMAQQNSPANIAMQGLGQVGQDFINKNVMQKQLMPAPGNFGMASSTMGPLQFGSSQSPLLAYLSMLGSKG